MHIVKNNFWYISFLSAEVRRQNYLEVKLPLLYRKVFFANKNSVDSIKTTIIFIGRKKVYICSTVKKKLKKLFISSCPNRNLLNTFSTNETLQMALK